MPVAKKKTIKKKTSTKRKSSKTTKSKYLNKVNFNQFTRKQIAVVFVAVVAVIGTVLLLQARAASTPLTFAEQATAGLDPTGKTIPAHNYEPPTSGKVVYISPAGNDKDSNSPDGSDTTGDGSIAKPYKTIQKAYEVIGKGSTGTIVLRGGEYRDWYTRDGQIAGFMEANLTFQAYKAEYPWFNGADVVKTGWEQSGNVWRIKWQTPYFCKSHLTKDGSSYRTKVPSTTGELVSPVSSNIKDGAPVVCNHPDTNRDPAYPVSADPQLAFANDVELNQTGTLAEVTNGSDNFYYDWNNEYLYIGKNPGTNTIELAKRSSLTVLAGAYRYELKGIGVKRFGSTAIHPVIYSGLGGASSPDKGELIVENSAFTQNAGNTIGLSGPKGASAIKRSVFSDNHYTGLGVNGFATSNPGAPNGFVIDSSIFSNNNKGITDTKCSASCGAAAVKLNNMTGYTVKNSIFEGTKGRAPGLWCDINCSGAKMVNNIARDNGGHGIFYEISSKGTIASNLIYNNGGSGIAVAASETKVYNNTVVNKRGNNVQAYWIWDDSRTAKDKGETWPYLESQYRNLGPNTNKIQFFNNLVVAQPRNPDGTRGARLLNFANGVETANSQYPPNTVSNEYFTELDYNIYYRPIGQGLYIWGKEGTSNNTKDRIMNRDELEAYSGQSWDNNSKIVEATESPDPFLDRNGLDFRLKTDSDAFKLKGRALSASEASAIGLTQAQATALPRGAIFPATATPPPEPENPNQPPTVQLASVSVPSPSPATISLSATATDTDGTIAKVEFYNGSTKLGEDTSSPYTYQWSNVVAGTYSVTARATDNKGATTTSTARSFTVNQPVVNPPTTPNPPAAPTGLTRSLRADWTKVRYVLDLSWQASPTQGTVEYQVRRNGEVIGLSNTTKFTDATIEGGALYTYSVRALANNLYSSPINTEAKAECFLVWCWLQ